MQDEKKINAKTKLAMGLSLFVFIGSYNAFIINSDSKLEGKFTKRLDETSLQSIAGTNQPASVSWQKLAPTELAKAPAESEASTDSTDTVNLSASSANEAALQEELNLQLVEVINVQKYPNGIQSFSGNLSTNNGVIESLSISLADGESMSASFTEMTGNVFEYEMNGESYSGIIYQVDPGSYLVNLNHGPLDGTRLKFQSTPSHLPEQLAEQHNIFIGSFGEDNSQAGPELVVENYPLDSDSSPTGFIF